jgi:hypothetical protein
MIMESMRVSTAVEAAIAARLQLEGIERIALLPRAEFLAVTVGGEIDAPVVVFIGWGGEVVERAYPGTAIWRAAIERYLAGPISTDPGDPIVRAAAEESLIRFPTLDRWLAWEEHERERRTEAHERRRELTAPRFWIGAP